MDKEEQEDDKQEEEKPVRLSLHVICKRHLPPDSNKKWNKKQILQELNKITHLRLDREKIGKIDSLELLGDKVTNLYLQSNWIEKIENLECLKNLTFITLSNNRIKQIENLLHLQKLIFLDLSENQISTVDKDEIPHSVTILNLQGNPCVQYPGYRQKLIVDLPQLKQLDCCMVLTQEQKAVADNASNAHDDDSDEDLTVLDVKNGTTTSDDLQSMAAMIMLRSQKRAEDLLTQHKQHNTQLDDLRTTWNVPPSSRTARSLKGNP